MSDAIAPLTQADLDAIAAKVARDPGDPLALEATFLLADAHRLRRELRRIVELVEDGAIRGERLLSVIERRARAALEAE